MRRERRQRHKAVERAGQLVEALLAKYGVASEVREQRLVTRWAEIVGERVAARSWPDGLSNGLLYVRVANSSWLHELSFLKDTIVERANRSVGAPPLVREVRLHLGARQGTADDLVATLATRNCPKPRPRPPRTPATGDTLRAIDAEADRIADADLREIIRNVRRRLGI